MAGSVDIVVLNWNERDETLACLGQLLDIDYPHYRVVITDNGSVDGSVQAFLEFAAVRGIPARRISGGDLKHAVCVSPKGLRSQKGCREVVIIENGRNLGFAGGVNSGLELCRSEKQSEYALLLNNDVLLPPGFLRSLVKTAEAGEKIGIVGGKILYEPRGDLHDGRRDIVWYAGGNISIIRGCGYVCLGSGLPDDGSWDRTGPTDFVTGAMMLIKRDVLETVGLLDPRFFFGGEDTDFCLRAKAEGFDIYYTSECTIWHKSTAFTYDEGMLVRLEYEYTGKALLWFKYLPAYLRWPLLIGHLVYGTLVAPYRLSALARQHGAHFRPSQFRRAFLRSYGRALAAIRSEARGV